MPCCHDERCSDLKELNSPAWRRALWAALAVNVSMFLAEIVAGVAANSASLQADSIDFLGDAANYAISLGVSGAGLTWRARAALLKGWSLGLLGAAVLFSTAQHIYVGVLPKAETMGAIGGLALLANIGVALTLYRFRSGDANMLSAWICSRNDAIGNLAVLSAAAGVFGSGSAWPDLIVATIMAGFSVSGGWRIVRRAHFELRGACITRVGAAR